jgi:fido (protein-threonine AMPylation protein)
MRVVESCEQNEDSPQYERVGYGVAVQMHARVIQTHPFEDGNGRTSRLLMNVILNRLGLRTIAIERPKQEYFEALGIFFASADVGPLVDLCLVCVELGLTTD